MFSLVLAYDRHPGLTDLHASYTFILNRVGEAVGGEAAGVRLEGICDLALGDRKFSGNAQQRKRDHLLHHGTLLFAFDADMVRALPEAAAAAAGVSCRTAAQRFSLQPALYRGQAEATPCALPGTPTKRRPIGRTTWSLSCVPTSTTVRSGLGAVEGFIDLQVVSIRFLAPVGAA